jgi:hypothetical protein
MEKVFTKLLGKYWIVYRGRDLAQYILRQICTDAKAYLRRVMSAECALMHMDPKLEGIRRVKSEPKIPCVRGHTI